MGSHCEVLAGHGTARHQRSDRAWCAGKIGCGRAQHQLRTEGAAGVAATPLSLGPVRLGLCKPGVMNALSPDNGKERHAGRASIGIGGSSDELRPCHTTRHAGPHRAVREVEVKRASERLVYRSGLRARRHSRRGRYCSTSAGSLPPRIERQRSEPQGRATPGTSSCLASIA